ncbi:MAG: NTP transferase domain-containing protein [Candidatus Omnitrophica bacterium]|nr:NTP transferase domain-containing protein [Candidatus Omnitrophota bacterium]
MNSNIPKILHKLGSKPMLGHVMENVQAAGIKNIFVITGYKSHLVEKYVGDKAKCIQQKSLLGTADAVWQIKDEAILRDKDARLLVIYGDTPLITEYYLTDVIEVFNKKGLSINSVLTEDQDEILGVNSRQGLAKAYRIFRTRILDKIIAGGVTVLDPETTFIDEKVKIGKDTVVYPYTFIEADVDIGKNCSIGPFCRIRSGCRISDDVSLGNFVEVNRSSIGESARIKHQSYIGDTIIGKNVNIGAGTIVANYDGKNKNQTIIEADAFIGTGTILVAPVKVGKGAMTGAGTVVPKNKDVPDRTIVVGVPARVFKKK